MILKLIKYKIKQLQFGRLRFILAIIASIQQTIVRRSLIIIYVDKDGYWHSNSSEVSLVSPFLHLTPWKTSYVLDLWCCKYLCKRGDVVVDVGAGIGDDTVAFSRLVGESGFVIAIEAHPVTYKCLLKTVEANNLRNVICVNAALGDGNGSVFFSDDENFMGNNFVAEGGTIKVRMKTLSDVLNETGFTEVSFLKMNIEGAEVCALNGMKDILKFIPNIVVSCHDFRTISGEAVSFQTLKSVSEILTDVGYKLYRRLEDRREEVPFYVYGTLENYLSCDDK